MQFALRNPIERYGDVAQFEIWAYWFVSKPALVRGEMTSVTLPSPRNSINIRTWLLNTQMYLF